MVSSRIGLNREGKGHKNTGRTPTHGRHSAEDTQDRQAPPRPQTHEAVHGQTRKPTTYGWFNLHQQVNAHQLQLSCARAQHAYRDSSPLLPWV